MGTRSRNRKTPGRAWMKPLIDGALIALSFLVALAIRFDLSIPRHYLVALLYLLPGIIAFYLVINLAFSLYTGKWKYASFEEMLNLSSATIIATAVLFVMMITIPGLRSVLPLSVGIMGGMISLFALAFARMQFRMLSEWRLSKTSPGRIRVLLVGAGESGEMLARDMILHPEHDMHPAGFVDDDPAKSNLVLKGVRVLGQTPDIPSLVQEHNIDEVLITIPSAPGETIRRILSYCEQTDAKVKVLPGIAVTALGEVGVAQVREIRPEDLLGREAVKMDLGSISAYISGKTVLITGAGGSIGSELARQLCRVSPRRLILLDNNETALYEVEMELASKRRAPPVELAVGDIRDNARLEQVFGWYKPQVIFHSAALKHVPLMEQNPGEAVKNNILGTRNVASKAVKHQAERFILISTDKAVQPASVMGATKRVSELMMKSMDMQNGTLFTAVRFGNVLGSRGSVVPVFEKQIEAGGPVLVTHPDIERYFMTMEEAAQLVIQAGAYTSGGDVFILDMGKPVRVMELARQMIRMLAPGRPIEIQITGLRPGEKLRETLLFGVEETLPTPHQKISRVMHEYQLPEDFDEQVEGIICSASGENVDGGDITVRLSDLLPSYEPGNLDRERLPDQELEKPSLIMVEGKGGSGREGG